MMILEKKITMMLKVKKKAGLVLKKFNKNQKINLKGAV